MVQISTTNTKICTNNDPEFGPTSVLLRSSTDLGPQVYFGQFHAINCRFCPTNVVFAVMLRKTCQNIQKLPKTIQNHSTEHPPHHNCHQCRKAPEGPPKAFPNMLSTSGSLPASLLPCLTAASSLPPSLLSCIPTPSACLPQERNRSLPPSSCLPPSLLSPSLPPPLSSCLNASQQMHGAKYLYVCICVCTCKCVCKSEGIQLYVFIRMHLQYRLSCYVGSKAKAQIPD